MTGSLQVRVHAGAVGEFSSPGSTFWADSYFGIRSTLPPCYRSSTDNVLVILPKVQVAGYI